MPYRTKPKIRLTPASLTWTEQGAQDLDALVRAAVGRGEDPIRARRRLVVACEDDAIERGFPLINSVCVKRAYHTLREKGDMP